ncbi:MAG: CRISPR-associated protein Csx19 [Alphaproteobacteria bacterium]
MACGDGRPIRCRLSASYLLWGTATLETAAADGWVCLTEARVGAHWIPFREPLAKSGRLHLRSVELAGTEPRYGNAHIMDELLHGIATTPAERSANAQ